MRRNNLQSEKKSIQGAVVVLILFSLIGFSLATEMLARVGLGDNYVYIVSLGLLFSVLLLGKKKLLVLCVLVGVLAINLSGTIMAAYVIDQDILLAMVCSFILVPTLYDLVLA